MTRDEILKLGAGREMDALVADLMGWTNTRRRHRGTLIMTPPADDPVRRGGQVPPHYSTDIAAAWEVLRKFEERDYSIVIEGGNYKSDIAWYVDLIAYADPNDIDSNVVGFDALASTIELAICRASLLTAWEVT